MVSRAWGAVGLELPAWKRLAIDNAAMGDNSKMMIGFRQPYWYVRHASNGTGSSDQASLQNTWETNPVNGSDTRAVLTHHAGGALARSLRPDTVQADAGAFLGDLERVLPGANEGVRRDADGKVLAFTENWSLNPLSRGSCTYARPGYFTNDRPQRSQAGRECAVRRRTHQQLLRVAGLHGRRRAFGPARGQRSLQPDVGPIGGTIARRSTKQPAPAGFLLAIVEPA